MPTRTVARWRLCGVGALSVSLAAAPSRAQEPPPPPAGEAPKGPAPLRLAFTMEPTDPSTSWVLRIDNQDSVPVRLAEDWRLLSLDVTPPPPARGKAVTQHCVLPAEMRPASVDNNALILPPERAHIAIVDPRAFCFGGQKEAALVPGATVVAHFGFPPDRSGQDRPPLVAVAAGGGAGRLGVKDVVTEPFTLKEPAPPSPQPSPPESPGAPSADEPGPTLTVSTPARIDVGNVRDFGLTVTVRNPSSRRVSVLLNPHTISVDVTNHFGVTVQCQWNLPPSPIADLYTTIPPGGRASTTVLIPDLCPPMVMAFPGLYSLTASLDTRAVSGESIGIHAFEGRATAAEPTLARIRTLKRGMRPPR